MLYISRIHLQSHLHQGCPLHLTHDAVASHSPLLRDGPRVEHVAEEAAGAPVLHQGPGLVLGDALEPEHPAVPESIIHTLVVLALVGVGLGNLAAGLASLELGEDELLRGVAVGVVRRCDTDDGSAVGQRSLA